MVGHMKPTTKLTERLNYNVSREQLKALYAAASHVGEPLALFVRKAALERAELVRIVASSK